MDHSSVRGDRTREALLATATAVFAREGLHAVTTRQIAESAGVNQALIGYHFRGKDGLYLAVFEQMVGELRQRIGPLADQIEAAVDAAGGSGKSPVSPQQRKQLTSMLFGLTDGMTALLSEERSAAWAQLIVREQQAPTDAFALLYDGFMGRVMSLLARLLGRLRGGEDADAHRLLAVTVIGQVLAFRVARAGVLRHMGWSEVGAPQVALIQQQVRENLAALLSIKD